MTALDSNNVEYKAWGSAGPDIVIEESNAIIEIKTDTGKASIKSAYDEIVCRTDPDFNYLNAPYVAVITPAKCLVWINDNKTYADVCNPDHTFTLPDEKNLVIAFFKTQSTDWRLPLEVHIDDVLHSIYSEKCPDSVAAMSCLLSLDRQISVHKDMIVIDNGENVDDEIIRCTKESCLYIRRAIVRRYSVTDMGFIRNHVRHMWSHYQEDNKKSTYGKYYTPEHIVDCAKELLSEYLSEYPDSTVADLAAGCGAFIGRFNEYPIIGRDIDQHAVNVLKKMGYTEVACDNSLYNVNREKLGISINERLVIVGNPPWNDTNSKNKRFGNNAKEKLKLSSYDASLGLMTVAANSEMLIDADIRTNDIGISFMRAFAKLQPDMICVVHPLSYLIKERNAGFIKQLLDRYTLEKAIVFSSSEFGAAITSGTAFPALIGMYRHGGSTTYKDITQFKFPIYSSKTETNEKCAQRQCTLADTGMRIVLGQIETIDSVKDHKGKTVPWVQKYASKREGGIAISDTGIYQYNLRDTNSLLASGNLCMRLEQDVIPVNFDMFPRHCYLNCMKRYMQRHFILGNISPLLSREHFSQEWFRDACVFDTIMNEQRIDLFRKDNQLNIVDKLFKVTSGCDEKTVSVRLIAKARRFKDTFEVEGVPNFYKAFVHFWSGDASQCSAMTEWFKSYFSKLRDDAIVSSAVIPAHSRTCP